MPNKNALLMKTAHQVLEDEIRSLQNLNLLLDDRFEKACQIVLKCRGDLFRGWSFGTCG
jgi:predicted metal-dependent hydrolase